MPARLAYPLIYRLATRGLDEDAHLRVDELLGDKSAGVRRAEQRRDAASMAGFEVG